jgi:hypothetical protein
VIERTITFRIADERLTPKQVDQLLRHIAALDKPGGEKLRNLRGLFGTANTTEDGKVCIDVRRDS